MNDPEPPADGRAVRSRLDESYRNVAAVILDSTSIPGLRWEMVLGYMSIHPCSDLHQVIFGPDSLHRATMAAARQSLVKRPADSALFALSESNRIIPISAAGSRGAALRSTRPVTWALSQMTGSRQLEACLSLFGG